MAYFVFGSLQHELYLNWFIIKRTAKYIQKQEDRVQMFVENRLYFVSVEDSY